MLLISYPKDRHKSLVGRLYDYLSYQVGEGQLKLGLDSLVHPGDDYEEAIQSGVRQADALLVLIDEGWSENPALQDRESYEYVALSTALAEKLRVIPILLEQANLPSADTLPDALAGLSKRIPLRITEDQFREEVAKLAEILPRQAPAETAPKLTPTPATPTATFSAPYQATSPSAPSMSLPRVDANEVYARFLALKQHPYYRVAVTAIIGIIGLLLLLYSVAFAWVKNDKNEWIDAFVERVEKDEEALDYIRNSTSDVPRSYLRNIADGLFTAKREGTLLSIVLGSDDEAEFKIAARSSNSFFDGVRLLDRTLLIVPLGALSLGVLAFLFWRGGLNEPRIVLGIIGVSLVLLLYPSIWAGLSNSAIESGLRDIESSSDTPDGVYEGFVASIASGYKLGMPRFLAFVAMLIGVAVWWLQRTQVQTAPAYAYAQAVPQEDEWVTPA